MSQSKDISRLERITYGIIETNFGMQSTCLKHLTSQGWKTTKLMPQWYLLGHILTFVKVPLPGRMKI